MRRAVPILLLPLLALAGCGGGDAEDGGAGTSDEPSTTLTVQVYPEGPSGSFAEYELTCEPAGGTLPDPEGVCDKLAEAAPQAFEPVPDDAMCTEQFGGPQLAKIEGTYDGKPVTAQFTRTNGCEIERWDRLAFLFPEDDGT